MAEIEPMPDPRFDKIEAEWIATHKGVGHSGLQHRYFFDAGLRVSEQRIAQLEEALREIASQKLTSEIEPIDDEVCGDFEYAYDCCINTARAALKGHVDGCSCFTNGVLFERDPRCEPDAPLPSLEDHPMTPQPKTCGECVQVRHNFSVVPYVEVQLCPRHASAEALYEAAKMAYEDVTGPITHSGIKIRYDTRDALRAAIEAYEGTAK